MTKHILVSCHSGITPHFSDLVSNTLLFKKEYPEQRIVEEISTKNYKDDSDYQNYPNILKVLKENNYNISNIVCTIPDEYIWSSSNKLRGFDRPEDVRYVQCTTNMDEIVNGEKKGFSDKDAGTLNAYIRFFYDKDTDTMYYYIVKNMGNHRFAMKAMANEGQPFEVLAKVKSHDKSKEFKQEDFIKVEADGHHADADLRASQNENQKFYSGYRSGHPEFVDCFNYLLQKQLNYNGIMKQEYEAAEGDYKKKFDKHENWPNLNSIQGLNKGLTNGLFAKYGKENVDYAIDTIRKAAIKYTKETQINNTIIWVTASSFKSLCDVHENRTVCKHRELQNYILDLFKFSNTNIMQDPMKIKDFTQKGGIKDYNYIAIEKFFKGNVFNNWIKKTQNRKTGYTVDHPGFSHLIDGVTSLLRKQAMSNCL